MTTPGCPHCASVHRILTDLVSEGKLPGFSEIDISREPEIANRYGVRSVPWFRIGEFEFSGSHTGRELERWLPGHTPALTLADFFAEELRQGGLARVTDRVKREPQALEAVVALMAEPELDISVQLGVAAVMEQLEGTDTLVRIIPKLIALLGRPEVRIRADVCHYLGLSGDADAIPELTKCLEDEHADVREIARDSIDAIESAQLAQKS